MQGGQQTLMGFATKQNANARDIAKNEDIANTNNTNPQPLKAQKSGWPMIERKVCTITIPSSKRKQQERP